MGDLHVLLVSHYLNAGGAGRATWRIFEALRSVEKETRVFASLRAIRGKSDLPTVLVGHPQSAEARRLLYWSKVWASRLMARGLFRPVEPSLCSSASVRSGLAAEISGGAWDLINLHWVGDATLSVEEIGEIDKPVIWSLHDNWPFSGAEHVSTSKRSATGYVQENRPNGERGPDLNRRVWERKVRSWHGKMGVIAPSTWSSQIAAESYIFRDSSITVIPHPLDIDYWAENPQQEGTESKPYRSRRTLRLGVGAASGAQAWVKGLNLLPEILAELLAMDQWNPDDIELWTFGSGVPDLNGLGIAINRIGDLGDDEMRNFYHSVDLMLVPSLFETFGLVAAEAQASGTPVIAFSRTGVQSIVEHKKTGYLAAYGDVSDFAAGIAWAGSSTNLLRELSTASKKNVAQKFNPEVVGRLYAKFIRDFYEKSVDS